MMGLGAVEGDFVHFAGTARAMLGFVVILQVFLDYFEELVDAGAFAGADVEGAVAAVFDGLHIGFHDVVDVNEVALLGSVAENPGLMAVEDGLNEDGDYAGLAVGVLAGPYTLP